MENYPVIRHNTVSFLYGHPTQFPAISKTLFRVGETGLYGYYLVLSNGKKKKLGFKHLVL